MISVTQAVRDIVTHDPEALPSLVHGYMNFADYARRIHAQVEQQTKEQVALQTIVVCLSRIAGEVGGVDPYVVDIEIEKIATQLPLCELVFDKDPDTIAALAHAAQLANASDFFTTTISTREVTIIVSEYLVPRVLELCSRPPVMRIDNLASINISLGPKYYPMSNITFSLIRRIALQHIPLAETITTRTEIIFVFAAKYLGVVVGLFR